jgi:P-type Mg2+ transporter
LIATTVIVSTIGMALPYAPVGTALGFVPLPATYWAILPVIIGVYAVCAHAVKVWFVRRWGL